MLLAVALLLASGGGARSERDADREAAKRHFQRGRELFGSEQYQAALGEFEIARQLAAIPELDYNVGRCHDLLEHWALAADAYQRFLDGKPDAPDAPAIRDRVRLLRMRVPPTIAPPATPVEKPAPIDSPTVVSAPAPEPKSRLGGAAVGVGVAAVVIGALAAGLYGSASSDFHDLQGACAGRLCGPEDWSSAQAKANAGYALVGVAAAVAVVDVVLWAIRARRGAR